MDEREIHRIQSNIAGAKCPTSTVSVTWCSEGAVSCVPV
jgi:hypothetical protein